jgi:hypothetical protein
MISTGKVPPDVVIALISGFDLRLCEIVLRRFPAPIQTTRPSSRARI